MLNRRVLTCQLIATQSAIIAAHRSVGTRGEQHHAKSESHSKVDNDALGIWPTKTQNPLFAISAGVATALAGYTVFCYAKDEARLGDERSSGDDARRRRDHSEQLTRKLAKRYSIIGHTDVDLPHPPRGITGSDFETRKIDAAFNAPDHRRNGGNVWRREFVNTSVHDREQSAQNHTRDREAFIPGAAGDNWRDDHMNVLVHEQEIHMPGTVEEMERTDRLDAEAATPPKFLTDRNAQTLQGFRLTSREHGNEESNTAASPSEIKRDIKPLVSEGSSRVYAKKEDITKADNRSLDGGAKASRDGQAMMDYAKRIASLP